MRPATARILTLDSAAAWRAHVRFNGATLAVTNGCFDLLHAGHVESLHAARNEADVLLVLLNSDASVRSLKGPTRPVHGEAARAMVLAGMRCVDAVVVFDGTDCAAELATLSPDVYVKSAEYRGRQNPAEAAALEHCGTEIVWIERDERYSSSAAIAAAATLGAPGNADLRIGSEPNRSSAFPGTDMTGRDGWGVP
jgi:rfaE bifunctional protein nucleotidyltransferase chain/domain